MLTHLAIPSMGPNSMWHTNAALHGHKINQGSKLSLSTNITQKKNQKLYFRLLYVLKILVIYLCSKDNWLFWCRIFYYTTVQKCKHSACFFCSVGLRNKPDAEATACWRIFDAHVWSPCVTYIQKHILYGPHLPWSPQLCLFNGVVDSQTRSSHGMPDAQGQALVDYYFDKKWLECEKNEHLILTVLDK